MSEVAAPKFVFGEKLTDRVTNAVAESDAAAAETSATSETTTTTAGANDENGSTSAGGGGGNVLWTSKAEALLDLESDDAANTLLKLNGCKLFVLDTDMCNWTERGYGVLKLIETSDALNTKIMMWTDKCFRLILNTKLFEKMQIDRANKKSVRLNAFDTAVGTPAAATMRIVLIKAATQNDCDELYEVLKLRLAEFNESARKWSLNNSSSSKSSRSSGDASSLMGKYVVFKVS